jgi:hypothetical protein
MYFNITAQLVDFEYPIKIESFMEKIINLMIRTMDRIDYATFSIIVNILKDSDPDAIFFLRQTCKQFRDWIQLNEVFPLGDVGGWFLYDGWSLYDIYARLGKQNDIRDSDVYIDKIIETQSFELLKYMRIHVRNKMDSYQFEKYKRYTTIHDNRNSYLTAIYCASREKYKFDLICKIFLVCNYEFIRHRTVGWSRFHKLELRHVKLLYPRLNIVHEWVNRAIMSGNYEEFKQCTDDDMVFLSDNIPQDKKDVIYKIRNEEDVNEIFNLIKTLQYPFAPHELKY